MLKADTYSDIFKTIKRDCSVLQTHWIMDYSLLLAVHNMDEAAREETGANLNPSRSKGGRENKLNGFRWVQLHCPSSHLSSINMKLNSFRFFLFIIIRWIPATNVKGERLVWSLGIVDILHKYGVKKMMENEMKAIIHDGVRLFPSISPIQKFLQFFHIAGYLFCDGT
jgi:1-phosphatidylinositol-4-phosphate 5-kinase